MIGLLWMMICPAHAYTCLPCGSPWPPCEVVVDAPYVLVGMLVDERIVQAHEPEWVTHVDMNRQRQLILRLEDVVRQPADALSVGDQVIVEMLPTLHYKPVGPSGDFGEPGDTVLFFADPHPDQGRGGRLVVRHREALVRATTEADSRCEAVARLGRSHAVCGRGPYVLGAMGPPPGKAPGDQPDLSLRGMEADHKRACDGMAWTDVLAQLREQPDG